MIKRLFDIMVVLAAALPAILLVAICLVLVRRDSRGPGIFAQKRVGRGGVIFTCYKLRTMYVDTRDAPTHKTDRNSVTPIGAILRKLKLDELPQLWNVLRGDMSIVGPRPCLPSQFELIEARRANGVLSLSPGITGVAQIQGIDMSDPGRLAQEDAKYIGSAGFIRDIKIIVATVLGAGRGDRVSESR